MERRGPRPLPEVRVKEAANKIIESCHAKLVRVEQRIVSCEDEELKRLDLYISGVSVDVATKMNVAMAEYLAETNDENDLDDIVPIFILTEEETMRR